MAIELLLLASVTHYDAWEPNSTQTVSFLSLEKEEALKVSQQEVINALDFKAGVWESKSVILAASPSGCLLLNPGIPPEQCSLCCGKLRCCPQWYLVLPLHFAHASDAPAIV